MVRDLANPADREPATLRELLHAIAAEKRAHDPPVSRVEIRGPPSAPPLHHAQPPSIPSASARANRHSSSPFPAR